MWRHVFAVTRKQVNNCRFTVSATQNRVIAAALKTQLRLAPLGCAPRMRKSLNSQGKKPTHVCVICWQRLTLTFDKSTGRYLITNGLNHMRDVHAEEKVAKQSQGRKDDKSISTLAGMLAAGGTLASSVENYVVTAAQMALSSTARFCV